jgi:cytochrome b6-f complex iron-sulfur subunit
MSEPEDREAKDKNKEQKSTDITRRDFFNEVAGGALGIAAVGSAAVTVQYISPNVLFEPPPMFRVGPPENYPINSVTTFSDQQVYVVRTPTGFFAETVICQHLGCITQWNPEDNLIECPCHGSRYKMDGAIVRGPTTRPLPHFAVRLMPDGTLQVDKSDVVSAALILKV